MGKVRLRSRFRARALWITLAGILICAGLGLVAHSSWPEFSVSRSVPSVSLPLPPATVDDDGIQLKTIGVHENKAIAYYGNLSNIFGAIFSFIGLVILAFQTWGPIGGRPPPNGGGSNGKNRSLGKGNLSEITEWTFQLKRERHIKGPRGWLFPEVNAAGFLCVDGFYKSSALKNYLGDITNQISCSLDSFLFTEALDAPMVFGFPGQDDDTEIIREYALFKARYYVHEGLLKEDNLAETECVSTEGVSPDAYSRLLVIGLGGTGIEALRWLMAVEKLDDILLELRKYGNHSSDYRDEDLFGSFLERDLSANWTLFFDGLDEPSRKSVVTGQPGHGRSFFDELFNSSRDYDEIDYRGLRNDGFSPGSTARDWLENHLGEFETRLRSDLWSRTLSFEEKEEDGFLSKHNQRIGLGSPRPVSAFERNLGRVNFFKGVSALYKELATFMELDDLSPFLIGNNKENFAKTSWITEISLRKELHNIRGKGGSAKQESMPEIHIVSSLAGGTGSGLFLDVAHFLRFYSEEFSAWKAATFFSRRPDVSAGDLKRSGIQLLQSLANHRGLNFWKSGFGFKVGTAALSDRDNSQLYRSLDKSLLAHLLKNSSVFLCEQNFSNVLSIPVGMKSWVLRMKPSLELKNNFPESPFFEKSDRTGALACARADLFSRSLSSRGIEFINLRISEDMALLYSFLRRIDRTLSDSTICAMDLLLARVRTAKVSNWVSVLVAQFSAIADRVSFARFAGSRLA